MNSELLTFSSLFIIIFLALKIWKKLKNVNLPPGPTKLPIIGNLHQIAGGLFHRKLRDLANEYGPVMKLQFGEIPTVVISSAEAAKDVMKKHDVVFAQRPFTLMSQIVFYGRSDILSAPLGENWRQLRRISISEFLSSKRVQSYQKIREEEVANLITYISDFAVTASPVNLSKKLFSLSCTIIERATFGDKCENEEAFTSIVEEVLDTLGNPSVSELFPSIKFLPLITGYQSKLQNLRQRVDLVLGNIIKEHRSRRATLKSQDRAVGDNFVDNLLILEENGSLEIPLTPDSFKAVILDMFLGGIETSATIIEWAMSEMIKNPSVMLKAQAEIREVLGETRNIVDETNISALKYLKLVIKETLRLHPPGPLGGARESREQCKINGYDIPIKTRVLVNAWAASTDPNFWIEPDKFYPERFMDCNIDYKGVNFEFLPFGAGRRICPGIAFGMSNVELALAWLLYYFDWEFHNGKEKEDLDMTEIFVGVVRRKNDLCLTPIPVRTFPVN